MEDVLGHLAARGFQPRVVIDAGANVGLWTRMALRYFREAHYHLVEPQLGCQAALQQLAFDRRELTIHAVAVTEPGTDRVWMVGGEASHDGSGARVCSTGESSEEGVYYPATTLDVLFADTVLASDRPLLKLDLEGHELSALRGGCRLLDAVEVILSEVSFFQINDNKALPVFADCLEFLRGRGFDLYDFAALYPRTRDQRLRMGDALFVRRRSTLLADQSF
jgi:FkbM family methyltransferase